MDRVSVTRAFFRWCVALFAFLTVSVYAQAQVNNAAFVSQSVPTSMTAGYTYSVSVTMKNTGTSTWTAASAYRLGSLYPSSWGIGRVELNNSVGPDQLYTFSFLVTAPSTPGTYNFQWKMLRELVEWFGVATPNVAVTVNAPSQTNGAQFIGQNVPATMLAGQTYGVSVTMKNTGTSTWTPSGMYHLGSYNPIDNRTWGPNRVELNKSVPPGQQYTFSFTVTAPTAVGAQNFQWMMVEDAVEWFGATSTNVAVAISPTPTVTLDPIPTTATRKSAFEYDPTTGLLTKEIIEPDNSQLRLETTYGYADGFGNKTSATVSSPAAPGDTRTSTTTYDSRGQFPVSSANPLNHTETKTFETAFGQQKTLTGPNNLQTQWQYDDFGRKTWEIRADGTRTKWEYLYCAGINGGTFTKCPALAKYVVQMTPFKADSITPNGRWTYAYYDALGRQIRQETNDIAADLSIVTARVDTEYDSVGHVYRKSRPYYETDSTIYWTFFSYDYLGRTTAVTNPDNTQTTTIYNGLTVTTVNAQDWSTTRVNNEMGQLAQVTDAVNNTILYKYDPFGNLARTTDARGNVTMLTYNIRGQKTRMVDSDMGTWTYEYDPFGRLKKQTDNKAQVTNIAYDKLGRMTSRSEPDLNSTWTYDNCSMGIGKLCSATTDNGYAASVTYDNKGRPTSTSTTIDTVYNSSVTYDENSNVATRTYPNGLTVKYIYQLGSLYEVRNNTTNALYWRLDRENAAGQHVQETFGNGIITQNLFDPTTGRIKNIYAGAGNGVQNLAFDYDSLGNLRGRSDGNQGLSESFVYDSLNRLKSATVNSGGAGVVTQSFEYDGIGNISVRSGLGAYTYGPSNAKPHAVMQVALEDGGKRVYSYDQNGNMTGSTDYDASNNVVAANNRNYTYTTFNMPSSMIAPAATLTFNYGPDHQRTKQITPFGTTIYLHPDNAGSMFYEKEIKSDGSIEHKNYINAGSNVVALVKQVDATTITRYFHRDSLGSTTAITDESGAVVERLSYEPFGKRRNPNGATDTNNTIVGVNTDRGYTNHEHLEELGLIHMNARVYDPVIGRFMNADPLIESPNNLQSYNRYAYVWNNPLIYTDPTGNFKWGHFRDKWLKPIAAIGAAYFTGGWAYNAFMGSAISSAGGAMAITGAQFAAASQTAAIVGGATGGFAGGFVGSGGDPKAAAIGGISGGLFGWAGGIESTAAKYGAHAVAGCASGEMTDSGCGRGATSAVAGKYLTNATDDWGAIERGVATAVAGGTVSVIGGGKFGNGAVTAAYGYLFNCGMHAGCWARLGQGLQGLYYRVAPYAQEAATVIEALAMAGTGTPSPTTILMPGGNPIGWIEGGADSRVRTVLRTDFDQIVGSLLNQSEQVSKSNFPGSWYRLKDGSGEWGLRMSGSNGVTLQLKVNNVDYDKIHYLQSLSDQIPK